ncbi:dnaJ homolog subfamily C member 10 [Orussus abietinus]|uniref:dnaJ homolog subfamily C member 10 n=1 Tax=Orussus abietinus TaxID=222816 RepID=UPI000625A2EF|nr:dnaJ homolog subfamily C member 10 [Orussus abietinus]XP_012286038.1 dnaJ homolog subfamily C member 10 [Orussus abietinus]XP_012286040.1 dnaJ homolog subfamily C member 10 [Orussus abietinus]
MHLTSAILLFVISLTSAGDYYELLGVQKTADQREIRKAFKKLAVSQHPDKNKEDPKAHETFIKLTTAYEVLKDPELRKKYDLYGEEGLDGSNKQRTYQSWTYYQYNFGIYDDDPEIVTLNKNDYYDNVLNSDKMWLVNFYSPMCSHCHHLAPVWRSVAKDLDGVIRIGAVNCEDDWQLCHQLGIQAYPTLLYYPKNARQGDKYRGERTREAFVRFVLDRVDAKIREISKSVWILLLKGDDVPEPTKRPTLIFVCGKDNNCFEPDEHLKVAAMFDKMVNVRIFNCEDKCSSYALPHNTHAVYLPARNKESSSPEFFYDIDDVDQLIQKVLEQLPEPQDLSADEFKSIKRHLRSGSDAGWLICFYMGHETILDLQLKRLPSIVHDINLGKIHCGKYPDICNDLNVNRYPQWGVLKPGGAFELTHGKSTMNHLAKFAEESIRAKNVWALSAEKILSIMQRTDSTRVWFLDWYAPWCPPCVQFLPEVRKASLHFDTPVVHFGIIDCTVHASICRQYNIRSYPTAMLINGSNTYQFTLDKTAASIVHFINEAMNPSVIRLTSKNFEQRIIKKRARLIWAVDYFAPWCTPCQQLAPIWTSVAKAFNSLPFVKIANVDCEVEAQLCGSQRVRSYPTIRLYPLGGDGYQSPAVYDGPRDVLSIKKWITDFFPVTVQELNAITLEEDALISKDIWLVDYFAPWCSHCHSLEPEFAIAAQLLDGEVRLGRINCDNFRSQCVKAGVRAYPTLILYGLRHKNQYDIYKGVQVQATTGEEIKENVLKLISSIGKKAHDEL